MSGPGSDLVGVLIAAAVFAGCAGPTRPAPTPGASEAPLSKPWLEARDRGVDFRAIGQEPGWFLEIDTEKQMRLVYDYAEREAITPVAPPTRRDGATTYDATNGTHRLRVVIEDRPCHDVMSGDAFPRSVIVTIDDRGLHGCGRSLSAVGPP